MRFLVVKSLNLKWSAVSGKVASIKKFQPTQFSKKLKNGQRNSGALIHATSWCGRILIVSATSRVVKCQIGLCADPEAFNGLVWFKPTINFNGVEAVKGEQSQKLKLHSFNQVKDRQSCCFGGLVVGFKEVFF